MYIFFINTNSKSKNKNIHMHIISRSKQLLNNFKRFSLLIYYYF